MGWGRTHRRVRLPEAKGRHHLDLGSVLTCTRVCGSHTDPGAPRRGVQPVGRRNRAGPPELLTAAPLSPRGWRAGTRGCWLGWAGCAHTGDRRGQCHSCPRPRLPHSTAAPAAPRLSHPEEASRFLKLTVEAGRGPRRGPVPALRWVGAGQVLDGHSPEITESGFQSLPNSEGAPPASAQEAATPSPQHRGGTFPVALLSLLPAPHPQKTHTHTERQGRERRLRQRCPVGRGRRMGNHPTSPQPCAAPAPARVGLRENSPTCGGPAGALAAPDLLCQVQGQAGFPLGGKSWALRPLTPLPQTPEKSSGPGNE